MTSTIIDASGPAEAMVSLSLVGSRQDPRDSAQPEWGIRYIDTLTDGSAPGRSEQSRNGVLLWHRSPLRALDEKHNLRLVESSEVYCMLICAG